MKTKISSKPRKNQASPKGGAPKKKAKKRKKTSGSGMGGSRNLGYFLFQVFIILGAFVGISRCSPLAPSQNIAALEAGGSAGGPGGRRADTTGSAAGAAIAQSQLAAALDASPRDIAVEYVVVRAAEEINEPARLLFRLGLASEERDHLRNNLAVELSLSNRSAATNRSGDDIQNALRTLRQNIATARPTLRVYLLESSLPPAFRQQLGPTNLAGNLAVAEIDGRIRLGSINVGDPSVFRRAVQLAQVLYLDI